MDNSTSLITRRYPLTGWAAKIPGLGVITVVTAAAMLANHFVPLASAMVVATVIAAIWVNLRPLPIAWAPGIGFASKHLLRVGVILLGLQSSLSGLAALGWQRIVLVVCVVAIGVLGTIRIGRAMGLPDPLVKLIACGFSICGAAAVAGAKDVAKADEDQTGTALMLVVAFGTAAIPTIPWVAHLLGLETIQAATWAGAGIHEVGQVVAAAAVIGPQALPVAVPVKLGRVVCLAGVLAAMAWRGAGAHGTNKGRRSKGPVVPGFVLGFLACVVLASLFHLPTGVLHAAKLLQTILLTMAMAGLGFGINIRGMRRMGPRPLLLAVCATLLVWIVSLTGVLLIG